MLGWSAQHLSDLLERWEDYDIHLVSLSVGINAITPGGKLVFHILSVATEFQREIIAQNGIADIELLGARK
jgi:DNA invertase Pin-like site-specific DNA recombinase